MGMPRRLVLVRHGKSEGNSIQAAIKQGKTIQVPSEYNERHTMDWRLTDQGIVQAKTAGKWIMENIGDQFERFYTSNYLRAMETAALLNLKNADWFINLFIHERSWGLLDHYSHEERLEKFAKDMEAKDSYPFFWAPPRGESFSDLVVRITQVLNTLHRECDGQKIIIVCHGEIMWAFRIILERITIQEFLKIDESQNPFDRIHNGQVIEYSKLDPVTSEKSKYLDWVRSICPTDLTLSSNEWQKIDRKRYSNDALLQLVKKVPRLIND